MKKLQANPKSLRQEASIQNYLSAIYVVKCQYMVNKILQKPYSFGTLGAWKGDMKPEASAFSYFLPPPFGLKSEIRIYIYILKALST